MPQYISKSEDETIQLGMKLAKKLKPGCFVAFTGGLGAGKTAFCRGIAQGLDCIDTACSPTFAIVNYYRGRQPFAHFDLYRGASEQALETAGFFDYLDAGAVVAAEWSENMDKALCTPDITIDITQLDENTRCFNISGVEI